MDEFEATLPPGYVVRPAVMDDIPEVVEIENRRARHDIGEGDMTVARLRMFWEEPGRDIARDTRVVVDDHGRVVACADVYEEEPFDAHELAFVVDPDHSGKGIENWVIGWGIQRACASLAKAPTTGQVTLETQVWATNVENQKRLRAAGFEQSRVWNRMIVEMDAPPEEDGIPSGIAIRAFQRDEVDRVHEAWEDAQRDEWGFSSLTPEEFRYFLVEQEEDFDPSLWFLAIDDASGEIAGYCLCRWERPGVAEAGQVRYLGVRRQHRRRGIGAALLRHAFAEFYQRGRRAVSLNVDSSSLTGAERVYERAGMRIAAQAIVFEKVLRENREGK